MILFLDNNMSLFNEYIICGIGYIIENIYNIIILSMISLGVVLPIILFSY